MTIRPPASIDHSPPTTGTGGFARAGLMLVLAGLLSACGQKGDLYLATPEPTAAQPAPLAPTDSGERLQDLDISAAPGAIPGIPAPAPLGD